MEANIKYLKDENGEIVSPVVSTKSVFSEDGVSLYNITRVEQLCLNTDGQGSSTASYTLTSPLSDFDFLIVVCGFTSDSSFNEHIIAPFTPGHWNTSQTWSILIGTGRITISITGTNQIKVVCNTSNGSYTSFRQVQGVRLK